jgi:hypothetical protein
MADNMATIADIRSSCLPTEQWSSPFGFVKSRFSYDSSSYSISNSYYSLSGTQIVVIMYRNKGP